MRPLHGTAKSLAPGGDGFYIARFFGRRWGMPA
jgi:hypothetical protein